MSTVPFSRPVGVIVVGCGRISDSHIKAIQAQPEVGTLLAVVDTDPARAAECAAKFGVPHHFSSYDEALALDGVEAVILCSPNTVHADQAEAAMRAGKHVLVEKPFTETVEEAERIAALADETGLTLAAAHTFRHVKAIHYLQDHLAEFGHLRALNMSMCVRWEGPQTPWWATRTPEEGLVLTQLAPHALDFVQMCFGDDDPVRVSVEASHNQPGWLAEDEAMILLRYPGDRMAFVHTSYNQHYFINRRELHFDDKTVRVEEGDTLYVDKDMVVEPPGELKAGFHRLGGDHYYRMQFLQFALQVRTGKSRSVLHPDAVRLMRLNSKVLQLAVDSWVPKASEYE